MPYFAGLYNKIDHEAVNVASIAVDCSRDDALDYVTRMVTFTGISVPIFVTGLMVIYLLVRLFNWFPPLGYAMLWEAPWVNVQNVSAV